MAGERASGAHSGVSWHQLTPPTPRKQIPAGPLLGQEGGAACLISGSWPEPQLERLTRWPLRLTSRGQCLPGELVAQAVAPLPSLPDSQISLENHGCWILRRGQLPLQTARWGRGTCPFPLVPQHEPEGLGPQRAAAPLLIPMAAWVSGDPPGICTRGEVGMMRMPQEGPWNGAQRPGSHPDPEPL